MKKRMLALLLSVAMVFSFAACGSKEQTEESKEEVKEDDEKTDEITLEVAYMPNYGSLWAVTTAIEKGYFDEEGINVNLTSFQDGPTIISAMESGSIDIGYIGHGAHKLCIQGNAKIFALSHISNGDAVIGGPDVKTLEDLKGKTIIGGRKGGMPEMTFEWALRENGLDPKKDVNIDTSIAFAAMQGAFIGGTGDFVTLFEHNAT